MGTYISADTIPGTVTEGRLGRTALRGAVLGMVASLVMAAFAMMAAATYQRSGFFTPLYHIASTFISPSTMMTSMKDAMAGNEFFFALGPAILGAIVHMMVGAMYGVMFAVAARLLHLHGGIVLAAGVVWGGMAFLLSSFLALPIAAALLHSGDQITHMAAKVGYGTFLTEHLVFGLALGALLASRRAAHD